MNSRPTHPDPATLLSRRVREFLDTHRDDRAQPDAVGARSPWPGRPSRGPTVRHDRTQGIPPRPVSLWPEHTPETVTDRRRQGVATLADLRQLTPPAPPAVGIPIQVLITALIEAAPAVHDQPPRRQHTVLDETAARHHLDPDEFASLAGDVGTVIARARPPSGPQATRGKASLNALHAANLPCATETALARAHLRWAATIATPDLPRLWMTINGITNGIPAPVMLTVPATTHGPIATIQPTRDDLIGWYGIRDAVHHLDATVHAAADGRRWVTTATPGRENVLLALGLLDLTHPAAAAELARTGPTHLHLADIRSLLDRLPTPAGPADLSDAALKAVSDRNHWLIGTPDERTHRELVERHLPTALDDTVRARLAAGDTTTLAAALHAVAPTDTDLDRHVWRTEPRALDAVHTRQLLNETSREALERFADWQIHPHPSRAAALAARFPDRAIRRGLALTPDQLTRPDLDIAASVPAAPAAPAAEIPRPSVGPEL
ncbi:hypothetical protein [Frankia sp. Cas4]|uniref:hypothetical protein n=1 Tax=Frankia sp. Cas4 TaxID=3073927 RepID=UPI002AD390A4|nr:hypothetical protein [Frankia sp. Cas4]